MSGELVVMLGLLAVNAIVYIFNVYIPWRKRVARAGEYDSQSGEFVPDDGYDIEGVPEPCQPIGCDAGRHLPGCKVVASYDADADFTYQCPFCHGVADHADNCPVNTVI